MFFRACISENMKLLDQRLIFLLESCINVDFLALICEFLFKFGDDMSLCFVVIRKEIVLVSASA